jgi:hypothetical protein
MLHQSGYNLRMARVLVGWLAVTFLAGTVRADQVAPQRVEEAIRRGVEYLRKQQSDGHWERGRWAQHATGRTALATYALLSAGQKENAPEVSAALMYLRKTPTTSVYALGLRAQVWQTLHPSREMRSFMAADLRALHMAIRSGGDAKGMFHYQPGKGQEYDHSTSQFGILGLWAMDRSGMEVETRTWRTADVTWRKHQLADGGWGYRFGPGEGPTVSMTAAGVATLFIIQDFTRNAAGCSGNPVDPNLDRGLQWIGDNFNRTFTENHLSGMPYYTLFGISRIGIVSGRKYLGEHDWYSQGARWLLNQQRMSGAWGGGEEIDDPVVATSFALLFLTRGSAPVVMQKLQYKVASGQALVEGPWAQRPRDLANLTAWMGRQMERNFNWQSTPIDVPASTLHEAPILYIGGHLAPVFSDEEKNTLRRFVQKGGLILGHADCGSAAFSTAFQKLGTELFDGYSFRELPREHAIYTSETIQYQPNKWPTRPSIMGLSNGVRELMLLIPSADVSKAWQMADDKAKAELFQLASNIVLYATDNQPARKGTTYRVQADQNKPITRIVAIARLRYEGNWDPEPGGWRRLAAVLHNTRGIRLLAEPVKLGDGRLAIYKVAHLTGTDKLQLTAAQLAELRAFIAAGGTLIVDSAGGSSAFIEAIGEQLPAILPKNAKLHEPVPADHAAFRGVGPVHFRSWARTKHLARGEKPQVRGYEVDGRMAVLFSGADLGAALVGQSIDGINGYTPKSGTELMEAMLLYAAGVNQ